MRQKQRKGDEQERKSILMMNLESIHPVPCALLIVIYVTHPAIS